MNTHLTIYGRAKLCFQVWRQYSEVARLRGERRKVSKALRGIYESLIDVKSNALKKTGVVGTEHENLEQAILHVAYALEEYRDGDGRVTTATATRGVGLVGYILVGCLVGGIGVGLSNFVGTGESTIGPPTPPGSVVPSSPRPATKPRAVSFSADAYGQFWIGGSANGIAFQFLADTGATDVVFSKHDALRLGIDVKRLIFDGRASTANGTVRLARARLALLSVGPFTVVNVPVSINDGEMDFPLLGMAFLRRLNVSIGDGTLTLSGDPS